MHISFGLVKAIKMLVPKLIYFEYEKGFGVIRFPRNFQALSSKILYLLFNNAFNNFITYFHLNDQSH